jgi:hypothetical protein
MRRTTEVGIARATSLPQTVRSAASVLFSEGAVWAFSVLGFFGFSGEFRFFLRRTGPAA